MVAYSPSPPLRLARGRRVRPWRLLLAASSVLVVGAADFGVKASALAAGGGVGVDVPTSVVRPMGSGLIGVLALVGVLVLPRLCLPGALLFLGGACSNFVSLFVWGGVPDPFAVPVAGGLLHFNLADSCIWAGSALFLAAVLWTLWRMPDDEFARLVNAPAPHAAT